MKIAILRRFKLAKKIRLNKEGNWQSGIGIKKTRRHGHA